MGDVYRPPLQLSPSNHRRTNRLETQQQANRLHDAVEPPREVLYPVAAFDATTGSQLWLVEGISHQPYYVDDGYGVVSGDVLLTTGEQGRLNLQSATDGHVLASLALASNEGDYGRSPAVVNGRVYVIEGDQLAAFGA